MSSVNLIKCSFFLCIALPFGSCLYWKDVFLNELLGQKFANTVSFCIVSSNQSTTSAAINVTAVDFYNNYVHGARYSVRSYIIRYVKPCDTKQSVGGSYVYLRSFLQTTINWTDICPNTVNVEITVSYAESTARVFTPCKNVGRYIGTPDEIRAWCFITYNMQKYYLEWINRDFNQTMTNFTSISFKDNAKNRKSLVFYNVKVNDTAPGANQAEKISGVLKLMTTGWWKQLSGVVNTTGVITVTSSYYYNSSYFVSSWFYLNASNLAVGPIDTTTTSTTTPTTTTTSSTTTTTAPTTKTTSSTTTTITPTTSTTTTTIKSTPSTLNSSTTFPTTTNFLKIQEQKHLEYLRQRGKQITHAWNIFIVIIILGVLLLLGTVGIIRMIVPRVAN